MDFECIVREQKEPIPIGKISSVKLVPFAGKKVLVTITELEPVAGQ